MFRPRREIKDEPNPNTTPPSRAPLYQNPDPQPPFPGAAPAHSQGAQPAQYSKLDQDPLANRIKNGSLGFVGDVLKITGEIHFKSMLRIDGKFSGQINSVEGTLILSSSGHVSDAVIDVAVAEIYGTINGDVTARERVVLGRSANVTGDLSTAALVIEEGAVFNGSCRKI